MKELGENPPVTYSKNDYNSNCTLSVLEKGNLYFSDRTSVLYTAIEQATSTTHSEMATIAVQTSAHAKRGMQKKKRKSTP